MDYNEIESLVQLAKANDKNAKEELMVKFTPLILNLSKRSFINSYEFADIKNECYHTLFKCVRFYDLDKHRFVAYATNAIKNSVNFLIRVSIRRNESDGPEAFILDGKLENTIGCDLEDFDSIMLNKVYRNRLTTTLHKLKKKKFKLAKDAFIHSDQGVHYTSPKFQKLAKSYKLGQSMSRRGNCWDNAPQESFFGHFKDEANIKTCVTLDELKKEIKEYMSYYNNYRYQWALEKMTPVQYRNHLLSSL